MIWCTMIFDLMLVSISLGVRITTRITTTIFTNFVLSAMTRQPDLLSRNNLGILLLQLSLDTGFNSWDASTDLGLILDPWFKSHRLDRLGRTFRPSKNCMPRSTVRSNATYPRLWFQSYWGFSKVKESSCPPWLKLMGCFKSIQIWQIFLTSSSWRMACTRSPAAWVKSGNPGLKDSTTLGTSFHSKNPSTIKNHVVWPPCSVCSQVYQNCLLSLAPICWKNREGHLTWTGHSELLF